MLKVNGMKVTIIGTVYSGVETLKRRLESFHGRANHLAKEELSLEEAGKVLASRVDSDRKARQKAIEVSTLMIDPRENLPSFEEVLTRGTVLICLDREVEDIFYRLLGESKTLEADTILTYLQGIENAFRFMEACRSKFRNFSLDYSELDSRFVELVRFLSIPFCPAECRQILDENPLVEKPNLVSIEDSRVHSCIQKAKENVALLRNLPFLKEASRKKIEDKKPELIVALDMNALQEIKARQSAILVDVVCSPSQIRYLLDDIKADQHIPDLTLIYSCKEVLNPILHEKCMYKYLRNGQLSLWHVDEWKGALSTEVSNPRSKFYSCSLVLAPQGHALEQEVLGQLQIHQSRLTPHVENRRASAISYYESDEFKQRLSKISEGMKPKVLVERHCYSTETKQVSDCMAKAFEKMGCEVFIHANCQKSLSRDYLESYELDIINFQPDLLIKVPNVASPHPAVPSVVSLHDLEPQTKLSERVKEGSFKALDQVFLAGRSHLEQALEAGLSRDQILVDHLPAEAFEGCLYKYAREATYDVGYVKTIHSISLAERVYATQAGQRGSQEKLAMRKLEKKLDAAALQFENLSFSAVLAMSESYDWMEQHCGYYEQAFSVAYMHALAERNFSLSLSGEAWKTFPKLSRFAHGAAHLREDYLKRFLDNRINISINPWLEMHQRILDGGRLGAFFLVYRVPEEDAQRAMPKDFVAGEHFDYFSNKEELVEKCRYYLDQEEKRLEIGENLAQLVSSKHSYANLCESILKNFRERIASHASLA